MEHFTGNQYDDDLTVGLDDLDYGSIDTGYVDLFEYAGDEESPISKLKTIMLSLEWEITDELLISFNDELRLAQEAWADDRVKMVYVQALQIISKYIYQKKADAHPNSMRVLLSFFYDLEKLALDTDLSEDEKKQILADDIKNFERFKQQIGLARRPVAPRTDVLAESVAGSEDRGGTDPDLYRLKASILSIDWEITDRELSGISSEIGKLQALYASSRTRMLLLKGLEALGGYIKLKKSEANTGAFRLFNSFFEALEKIVRGNLSGREEKDLLLTEVASFNQFKQEIASSITPEAIARQRELAKTGDLEPHITPALGDSGQEEPGHLPENVQTQAFFRKPEQGEPGFSEETLEKVASFFDEFENQEQAALNLTAEQALRGVEVETEADDDSDEDALPTLTDGELAPALADLDDDQEPGPAMAPAFVQGVEVETDADDDSDEEPLPVAEGEVAPALFTSDLEEGLPATASVGDTERDGADIDKHIETFFADSDFDLGDMDDEAAAPPAEVAGNADGFVTPALTGFQDEGTVDVPTRQDEAAAPPAEMAGNADELVQPALTGFQDEGAVDIPTRQDEAADEAVEESFGNEIADSLDSFFDEDLEKPILESETAEGERLDGLNAALEALDHDMSESTITALQTEIDHLKGQMIDRPVEKILLQLIATASLHIGKDYGSDGEALDLMRSISAILEQVSRQAVDQKQAQEMLLDETSKVLQWQKNLLDRKFTGKGGS